MANNVLTTPDWEKDYKRLKKKYKSLPDDVTGLIRQLLITPAMGESLGAGLYKVRLAVKSKGAGKSGGFRVITYLIRPQAPDTTVYLLTMYDKSEEENISKEVLEKMVKDNFSG